ncbi:periostin, osteoblast specific factor b isoform X2 [Mobula hypostoma]|uniref:periostin, osteoblast specific factor b isoform X2 n=1 Tax=Mobula hypostoma TaxID=723540 RepID=UPI002FC31651
MKLLFLSLFSLFVLTSFDQVESSYYDKILMHSRIRAKKEGPNMCALQQVVGTKKKYFSTCRNWYRKSICGRKTTTLYECCPGYMRFEGLLGCPAAAAIDHVYGTLSIVAARETKSYADRSNLREEIEGAGTYTFFAPSDEAWNLLEFDIRDALLSNVNIELLNALHYHMVNYRLLTKSMKNGMTVPSMYNDLKILINHYPNGVVTVNCARIIYANQIATNGVVHVIDRVITSVSNTLEEVIEDTDELGTFRAAAAVSRLFETLGKGGYYTIFAPTNEAFDKLDRGALERIMSDPVALQALMNYHILDSVQCSEAIMHGSAYTTLEGSNIEIGCDGDSLTINGYQMVNRKDIMTTNGVIHLIDEVLIPDAAKQVLELTSSKQTVFRDFLVKTGISTTFTEGAYTLFVPFNEAFTEEIRSYDQRYLKRILQNHILKVKVVLNELYNGQRLETIGGNLLRVFVYRTAVCIENSCMYRGSKEGRNGVLHSIKKIIFPAEKSIMKILRENSRFSIFLRLVEAAGFTEILKEGTDWTLFVPTNDAFASLSKSEIDQLMKNKNILRHIIFYHLLNGVYIGGGVETGVTNVLKSWQGSKVMVKMLNNTLMVNNMKTKQSDFMASNGVIHVVNTLLFPKDLPVTNDNLRRILSKLVKTIEIQLIPSYTYHRIEMPIIKTKVTEITRVVTTKPEIRVFSGKVIQSGTSDADALALSKVIERGTRYSKVTKIIEGDHKMLEDEELKKLVHGGRTELSHRSTAVGIRRTRNTMKRLPNNKLQG